MIWKAWLSWSECAARGWGQIMIYRQHGPEGPATVADQGCEPAGREPVMVDGLPTVVLEISSLLLDDSPRQDGQNDRHARALAESEEKLPPIIVHGQSMHVIDGTHRIRAAVMRGEGEIEAIIEALTQVRTEIEDQPHARLIVAEAVVPGPNHFHPVRLFDIDIMLNVGGSGRTEAHWKEIIAAAGLELVSTHEVSPLVTMFEVRPVASP